MSQSLRDEMDFRALVGDVKPLPQRNRADTGPQRQRPSEAQLARRESAAERLDERNFLSDDFVDLLPPFDPIEFRREGIQQGVVDKLKHGGYSVQAQLHMLRRPLAECRRMLFPFIQEAYAHDLRSVLVVHGRGRELDSPANVLRSYIAKWLTQFDEVQAYVSAQPSEGGLGATWVMLRKSDRAKANNRERQQKRRG
ncbi:MULTISPECIES: DNA endonuclease SmrA [Halomonadaceae]|jgi:DNA-nicking Smr family endonuclease|uniref:DNA endonuclease SmrA n=1 Tax=Halomonadaceae TaxID=28256 RepID=UPI0007841568|nr:MULTISPECIES: DNA endonuclease SmrA [Halomonas]MCP1304406.1 DNA endonuclease SmrA [Halomonas sp. R1t8]MCP1330797.1 DNA endonuclease SmrA [Halomonas sp. R1t4]MED5251627.1 DNA endonuclease SmrA [Pseudomonadota bacterium]